jgi:hypothetical protein
MTTALVQKLQAAFTERDYSSLSWLELFQLVDMKLIRPETAERLAHEVRAVVHSGGGVA